MTQTWRSKLSDKVRRRLRLIAILLVAWIVFAWIAARALIVEVDLPQADAIVVLAGSSTYLERTELASQLFQQGKGPRVLLTNDDLRAGWSEAEQRNPLLVELASSELQRRGVSPDRIQILPKVVSNTYEEAIGLREFCEANSLRSILVITTAYQSRRALWTLRRVFRGSEIEIGLKTPSAGIQTPSPAVWWLYPSGWKLVPGEYVKLAYYMLHY